MSSDAAAASSSQAAAGNAAPSGNRPVALIIGGGIAGCALALFLQRCGVEPRVYEAYPKLAEVFGGLGLAANGMNVLKSLGCDEALRHIASPVTHYEFGNSKGDILATVALNGKERYGADGVACTRRALHQVLHAQLEAQGIRVEYAKKLTIIRESEDDISCDFADGTSATGAFLIGADGLHSMTRQILFPSAKGPEYIGLLGFGGGVPLDELSEEQRARLPKEGTMRFVFGPLGFFGMSGFGVQDGTGKQVAGWWSNAPEPKHLSKAEMAAMSQNHVRERLLGLHGSWASPMPELVLRSTAHADGDVSAVTKVSICDVADLAQWTRGRALLIGDAAHAMSPNSGQGASMALEDAQALAVLVKRAVDGGKFSTRTEVQAVFSSLQALRKPRVDRINREARRRGEQKLHRTGPWGEWFRDRFLTMLFWAQNKFGSTKQFDEEFGYRAPGWQEIEPQQQQQQPSEPTQ